MHLPSKQSSRVRFPWWGSGGLYRPPSRVLMRFDSVWCKASGELTSGSSAYYAVSSYTAKPASHALAVRSNVMTCATSIKVMQRSLKAWNGDRYPGGAHADPVRLSRAMKRSSGPVDSCRNGAHARMTGIGIPSGLKSRSLSVRVALRVLGSLGEVDAAWNAFDTPHFQEAARLFPLAQLAEYGVLGAGVLGSNPRGKAKWTW